LQTWAETIRFNAYADGVRSLMNDADYERYSLYADLSKATEESCDHKSSLVNPDGTATCTWGCGKTFAITTSPGEQA
jgi:hypothetical protein